MKKFVLAILGLVMPVLVGAQEIRNYTVDLQLQKNGSVEVTEQIIFYALGGEEATFERTIPIRFTDDGNDLGRQKMEIQNPEVIWNNARDLVDLSSDERSATIVMGDEHAVLEPGQQEIVLTYTVLGALRHTEDHSSLRWEAFSGKEFNSIKQFAGSIHTPREYPIDQIDCYWETLLQDGTCSIDPRVDAVTIAYYAHMGVDENQSIIMVASFEQGLRSQVFLAGMVWWEWVLMAVVVLILGLLGWQGYKQYKKHQASRVIKTQDE